MAFRAITARASIASGAETINKPAGTVEGDLLVLVVASDGDTSTVTPDATYTFTEITGSPLTTTGDGQRLRVYLRVAGASEPASYAINCSAAVSSAQLVAYSGRAASTTPHQSSAAGNSTATASPTTVTATGITPTLDNCDLIYIGGVDNASSGTTTWTGPSGWNDRGIAASSNWTSVGVADLAQTTAAATGNISATFTHSGNAGKLAFLLALAPAGASGAIAGAAAQAATATGALTTGIALQVAAAAAATAAAALDQALRANATVQASAAGSLGGVQLAALAQAQADAQGLMTGIAAALAGNAAGVAAASATFNDRVFRMQLIDQARAPKANLTGLSWAWWPSVAAMLSQAPTASGSGETTDADGWFEAPAPAGASISEESGIGVIFNVDATPDDVEGGYFGMFRVQ